MQLTYVCSLQVLILLDKPTLLQSNIRLSVRRQHNIVWNRGFVSPWPQWHTDKVNCKQLISEYPNLLTELVSSRTLIITYLRRLCMLSQMPSCHLTSSSSLAAQCVDASHSTTYLGNYDPYPRELVLVDVLLTITPRPASRSVRS